MLDQVDIHPSHAYVNLPPNLVGVAAILFIYSLVSQVHKLVIQCIRHSKLFVHIPGQHT